MVYNFFLLLLLFLLLSAGEGEPDFFTVLLLVGVAFATETENAGCFENAVTLDLTAAAAVLDTVCDFDLVIALDAVSFLLLVFIFCERVCEPLAALDEVACDLLNFLLVAAEY